VDSRDRGFTLIELIVVMTVMGIAMSVLASATVVVLRTAPAVTGDIDEARSQRGLSTWLAQDAMSTYAVDVTGNVAIAWNPPASIFGFETHPGNPGLCPGTPAGTINLVEMAWKRGQGASTVYVANYRFDPNASNPRVLRMTCNGPSATSLTLRDSQILTQGLAASQPFPNVSDYDTVQNELIVRLLSQDGDTISVEVASRNPATP
jgi:prepilin-type N-terminal cleavage/methylation domain-containing protein